MGLPKQESAFGGVAEEGGCGRGPGNPDYGNTCLVDPVVCWLGDPLVKGPVPERALHLAEHQNVCHALLSHIL